MPRVIVALLLSLIMLSCGGDAPQAPSSKATKVELTILSGSENKGLEPLLQRYAADNNMDIRVTYKGSVDIMLELEKGEAVGFDAVWPANALWLRLGDRAHRVTREKSIMRSPVAFGVKDSVAEKLGWKNADIKVEDILTAAEAGKLRFAMTSATQSNSGASAYMGFLHAMAGGEEVLTAEHLADETVQGKVRRLLKSVNRSSGSSGWLKDSLLKSYFRYDAMVNYESLIIEANQELVRRGDEPLYVVYPVDGLMVADHPLALIKTSDSQLEQAFVGLQEYLVSAPIRAEIQKLGRRAGIVGLQVDHPDPNVFNPAWGIDVDRVISPVPIPEEPVIREALSLYQTALRKPSLTVYVLDYSGSMRGQGFNQLCEAMETLLEPEVARRYMLQSAAADEHIIIPFNSKPMYQWHTKGNDETELRELLRKVTQTSVGGGTNIYSATAAAFKVLAGYEDRLNEYFPAVILMTDGRSDGSLDQMLKDIEQYSFGKDVPIFSITFGDAQKQQLEEIEQQLDGRVFDGKKNLVDTFRKAKGYN